MSKGKGGGGGAASNSKKTVHEETRAKRMLKDLKEKMKAGSTINPAAIKRYEDVLKKPELTINSIEAMTPREVAAESARFDAALAAAERGDLTQTQFMAAQRRYERAMRAPVRSAVVPMATKIQKAALMARNTKNFEAYMRKNFPAMPASEIAKQKRSYGKLMVDELSKATKANPKKALTNDEVEALLKPVGEQSRELITAKNKPQGMWWARQQRLQAEEEARAARINKGREPIHPLNKEGQ